MIALPVARPPGAPTSSRVTSLSHWKDATARLGFESAYERAAASLWPVPRESRSVATPVGTTHVLISGDPRGEPMLLLHAAGTTALLWHRQVAHFAGRYRIHALDIVGDIGLSAQTAPIHARSDADAWLAAVLDGLGLERAILVGSSFGGFLATSFALAHPERVQALVLLAPAATLQPFSPLANLTIWIGGRIPMPFTVRPALRTMTGGALPDARFIAVMEEGVRGFRYDPHGIYPSMIEDEELASLCAPTLVLLGSEEAIYDAERAAERARRLIPGVRAEVLPGLGHLLGLQRPDEIDALVLEHLR